MSSPAESIAILRSMFEGTDDDVIQLVLEANGMNLPTTIEALLEMQKTATAAPPDPQKNIGLPDDFLRPPSYFRKSPSRQAQQTVDDDALLARLLQDEEFLQDLRNNPSLLDASPASKAGVRRTSLNRVGSGDSIREKIAFLGKSARRKLAKLANRLKHQEPPQSLAAQSQDYVHLASLDDPDHQNDGLVRNNTGEAPDQRRPHSQRLS